jgi:hypothetical protein
MEFVTLGGRGVITQWVDKEIEMEAEIEFHATLTALSVTPRDLWTRPDYAPFDPQISEIRFFANNLQHRVFGVLLTELSQYVMLVGATKKGKLYNPKEAVDTARQRRKLIIVDRSQLREYTGHKPKVAREN